MSSPAALTISLFTSYRFVHRQEGIGGKLRLFHDLQTTQGSTEIIWNWNLMEIMSVNVVGKQQIADRNKQLALALFYVNPNKTFQHLQVGGDVDVDGGIWT